jgi:2-oxoglutarate dehydrogenase E2 component (dihydrolipoamide succinyltransferase)
MATEVVMPQMGESIFEGTIIKWFKQPGDRVEKDEPLFEISTDKVDAEIPSPVAGMLSEIKIPEGETVQVNTVVALVAESGEANPAPARPKATAAEKQVVTTQAMGGGTDVVMPQMGESIFEGTIVKWLKKVGDRVEKDEPLFEISTDKVDAEIPAPLAGVLTEIRIEEGQTVVVNTVVAVIGGSTPAQVPAAPAKAAPVKTQPKAKAATVPQPVAAAATADQHVRSSPLVRRIAREHNVNLAQVAGSGSEGRITKDDILRYLKEGGAKRSVVPAAAPKPMTGEVVPLSRMRAIIAERMVESKRVSPHAHTVYKVDMTRVVRAREREKAAFEQRHGVKLTYLPFIATAVIAAVRKFPIVNASLVENSIHYHANIKLGIAVALDWGLIVPVVRGAEQRSFADLAKTIADLAGRARTKKLTPDEVGGSTITLTNSGIFGDEFSTPIINQPDSAILCISGLKKEPVVLTDAEGNDTIAIRSTQHFTLGFDHRLIDGADACQFMVEFKRVLESWNQEIA